MAKNYHIDATKVSLEKLQKRIEATDLIPSRVPLMEGIAEKFLLLRTFGISTLADLRKALKTKKTVSVMSEKTGVNEKYLLLLRREIEGYFPKPCAIDSFNWLPADDLEKLKNSGITTTMDIFVSFASSLRREAVCGNTGADPATVAILYQLSDLTRIQWTSPTTARMLLAAGYTGAVQVARANAEQLYHDLECSNSEKKLFKGTIGLRDVKRLIFAALALVDIH